MATSRAKLELVHAQLKLKVTLGGIRPPIWRRLLVPAGIKLSQFHTVLQEAFGWTESHLHAFRVGKDSYEPPAPIEWAKSYGPAPHDERKFRLGDLLKRKGARLRYEYDFGDSWVHEVLVEGVLPATSPEIVTCLAGARAGPPEDCGGIPGYGNLVRAMADPKHPDHAELVDWLGEPFDPERFDLAEINLLLKAIKV